MEFRVLGPVEVMAGDAAGSERRVPIVRRQERCVLAVLLLAAGQPVPTGRLVELLWSGQAPAGGRDAVQTYISRLRSTLADAGAAREGVTLVRQGAAYQLQVDPDRVDAHRFTAAVARARDLESSAARADLLRGALALWRGPALADIGPEALRERLGARLDESRRAALDLRISADLDTGRHAELVGELTELVAGSPLDERLAAHLMTALYRDGRRPSALRVFERVRERIRDELGLDPGAELQRLHTGMLRDDPTLRRTSPSAPRAAASEGAGTAAPAPPSSPRSSAGTGADRGTVPAQLPAVVPDFTGRDALLSRLDALVDGGGTVVVTAIAGAGGVGKTALAVRWAHRVADRFPDGQLFVNLRGFETAPPLRPIDALAGFLRALGVPGDQIPVDVDEAASRFRSALAGRRMLVVLDNAATAEQVRPLLPGTPACVVLVTSRAQLGGLTASHGARRLTVDLLSEAEALLLLRRIVGDERVDAEPDAALRLVHTCGCLPLAVRIAAAQLDTHPGLLIADHLADLRDRGPLDHLAIEGDELAGVRATFALSYDRLDDGERAVFRHIGLVPGVDVTAAACAALTGLSVPDTTRALDGLVTAHLVTQQRPGRFGLHDLLRAYARERVSIEDGDGARTVAVGRLLGYYLVTTDAAARLLYPNMVRLPLPELVPAPPAFDDHPGALGWLEAERRNLLAAIAHAATAGPAQGAWLLTDALRGFYWQGSHVVDWMAAVSASLDAANAAGDLRAVAAMRISIALAHQGQGRLDAAAEVFAEAIELSERAGWLDGQASAAGNLGVAQKNLGRLADAASSHERARRLHREVGYPAGEANALINLGGVFHDMGRLRESADHYARALEMHRQLGSPLGVIVALNNLAAVEHLLGVPTARHWVDEAMTVLSDVGKRHAEAHLLHTLGMIDRDSGDATLALYTAQAALAKAREAQDRPTEGEVHWLLGTIHHRLGRLAEATESLGVALDLLAGGSEHVRTRVAISVAAVLRDAGRHAEAASTAGAALDAARLRGHELLVADALLVLASIQLAGGGDGAMAVEQATEATRLHRATGHRLGEARGLRLLGDAASLAGNGTEAHARWRDALKVFDEIGAWEADELRPVVP